MEEATNEAEKNAEPQPKRDAAHIERDEVVMTLDKSVWHSPLNFVGAILLTIGGLVLAFFVVGDKPWARYTMLGLAVLGVLWLLWYLFRIKVCSTYTITQHRCTAEVGFISRKISEVQVRHIRNINVHQTVAQRIFGIGDVEISTAGGHGVEVVFVSVPDPLGVRRLIDDFRPSEVD